MAGNPNHDDKGRFSAAFNVARAAKDELERKVDEHGKALKAMSGGGPMGLTPDHIKATPEYKHAYAQFHGSKAQLGDFTQKINKAFPKESREFEKQRRAKWEADQLAKSKS